MVIKVKNNGEWVKIPYLSSDNNPIIPEAPLDGKQYARQSGEWTVVNIPEVDFTEINQKISQNTAAIAANTTAIQSKVDKVDGLGLSSNDYTSQEKNKLAGLNNYTLPTASDTVKGGIKVGTGLTMNGEVLSATGGGMADSVEWDNVLSKPKFATVATSGAYNDLTGRPSLATVATSGSYADLSNKPTIPTVDVTKSYVDTQLATKANASNVYTKAEVDSKVSSVYRVKGSVASYANLPTVDVTIGDVYNVNDTGANYVATSTTPTWDKLSETVDLSGYATTAAMNSALGNKVDKVSGKSLSTNDYTTAEKNKLAGLNNYTLPTASDTVKGGIKVGTGLTMNGEVLSATGGGMADSVEWDNVLSKPKFATVATSGAYNDLTGRPSLATVATSGSYADLSNKPTIPTVDVTKSYVDTQLATKANASNVYTKAEVDSKVSSVYRVKGSVASYANLPTVDVTIGDVYNVNDTGANYVATSTTPTWDKLSETVDLSGYATTAAMNSALGNKVDKVSGKSLSTNDYTTAEKNKLAGIAASANNYSLPAATSSVLGGVKTSTGITNSSGTISVTYGTAAGTACQGNDSRLSNSRPASDVSAWAKASTKPTYTWTEITSKPSWIGSSKPTYTASEVGALASGGTAVNASKVANSFIFKVAGGSTEGTNLYTFNGSAAKTINVVAGSNVTLTPTSGQLSISAKDTTYSVATTSANGLMSSAMVTKLNGIATNANNYSLPTATGSVLGGVKTGSNITNSSGTISLSSSNVTSALGYTPVKNESGVASIRVMTQSAYDSLSSKSATTLYIITG
jgi:hypothetical protein